ncbi:HAD-IA family hydrolase [Candidatus Peregrinibacteria bacterium]|nr:HAD-IA family hydrolase [Candidatus Peregrinibacteria bacterium]
MVLDKSKIKVVIFDWGGVCCREGEPFDSLDLQYTLNMNPDQIAEKVREIYNGYYIGKYDRDSFWRAIIQHFGLKENEKINSIVLSSAYLSSYEIYPEVFEVIKKLKLKYKIGLLSNLTPEMREHIRFKYNLKDYFESEVYSCDSDLESMKPNFKPYQLILKKLDVLPEATLFIDNSSKNIKAAETLGFNVILFKNVPQFLKEINFLL